MFQELTMIGHLGGDPELRYLPSGDPVTTMSVATSRKWTSKTGEKKEETLWFRVSVFGASAEHCNQYLSKGSLVYVRGQIQAPRIWEDREGKPRCNLEVRANQVLFLNRQSKPAAETDEEVGADELPF